MKWIKTEKAIKFYETVKYTDEERMARSKGSILLWRLVDEISESENISGEMLKEISKTLGKRWMRKRDSRRSRRNEW